MLQQENLGGKCRGQGLYCRLVPSKGLYCRPWYQVKVYTVGLGTSKGLHCRPWYQVKVYTAGLGTK